MPKMEKIINGQGKYFHNQLFNDSFLYPINYNRKGLFGLLKMHFMLQHLQQGISTVWFATNCNKSYILQLLLHEKLHLLQPIWS